MTEAGPDRHFHLKICCEGHLAMRWHAAELDAFAPLRAKILERFGRQDTICLIVATEYSYGWPRGSPAAPTRGSVVNICRALSA